MRFAILLGLVVVAGGCQDDNHRFDGDESAIHALEDRIGAAESKAAEQAAAMASYATQINAAKSEAAAARAELAIESARAAKAENDLVATLAMTTKSVATIMEPHLIGPKGDDLGRYLGPGVVWNESLNLVVDYTIPSQAILFEGADCTGTAITTWPVGLTHSHVVFSDDGRAWKASSFSQGAVASIFESGQCRNDKNIASGFVAIDTGMKRDGSFHASSFDVALRPAAR